MGGSTFSAAKKGLRPSWRVGPLFVWVKRTPKGKLTPLWGAMTASSDRMDVCGSSLGQSGWTFWFILFGPFVMAPKGEPLISTPLKKKDTANQNFGLQDPAFFLMSNLRIRVAP